MFDSYFPSDPLYAHLTIELRRFNMAARRRTARAFWDRMKFSRDAADQLIDKEGLDDIEELWDLDSKSCDRIVAKLIKPGGIDAATGDPNRGVEVSDRAQTNFTIVVQRAVISDIKFLRGRSFIDETSSEVSQKIIKFQ